MVCSRQLLNIEKIIPGGLGLAKLDDGLVVMVPRVLPGEKIIAQIGKKKKGYARAAILEILEPSPFRVDPPCSYYEECGGCDLQHISYQHQLEIKNSLLQEQFNHSFFMQKGDLGTNFIVIADSLNPFHYRQRIRVQVERGKVGFYRQGSHEIVEISECILAAPQINTVLDDLKSNSHMSVLLRNSESVELKLSSADNKVIVLVNLLRKPRPKDISVVKLIAENVTGLKSIFLQTKNWGVTGPFSPKAAVEDQDPNLLNFNLALGSSQLRMSVEAGGFCQVNSKQNDKLINKMLSWSMIGSEDKVLDLFCGMGNFSIPVAQKAGSVMGTDIQRSAIRSAKRNAENNGLINCNFLQRSAVKSARELANSDESFDLVILDPPRNGCREVVPYLKKIARHKIIYISCDPATLCRDLADIVIDGYKIIKVQAIDMFPQTHHIETIVLLEKDRS